MTDNRSIADADSDAVRESVVPLLDLHALIEEELRRSIDLSMLSRTAVFAIAQRLTHSITGARRLIVSFTMNGKPKPWERTIPLRSGSGRVTMVISTETKAYQKRIRGTASAAMFRRGGPMPAPGAPVAIEIVVFYKWAKSATKGRRALEGDFAPTQPGDWDNIGKNFGDALQASRTHGDAVCFKDDRMIVKATVEKRRCETEEEERVEVSIWDLTPIGRELK